MKQDSFLFCKFHFFIYIDESIIAHCLIIKLVLIMKLFSSFSRRSINSNGYGNFIRYLRHNVRVLSAPRILEIQGTC